MSKGLTSTEAATTPSAAPTKGAHAGVLAGQKLLVVDDSADIRRLLSCIFERAGAQVTLADGAERGIDLALAEDFHLVLMDLQMPGVNGLEGVELLRQRGYRKRVLALSAHDEPRHREAALDAGFDGYLCKGGMPLGLPALLVPWLGSGAGR